MAYFGLNEIVYPWSISVLRHMRFEEKPSDIRVFCISISIAWQLVPIVWTWIVQGVHKNLDFNLAVLTAINLGVEVAVKAGAI